MGKKVYINASIENRIYKLRKRGLSFADISHKFNLSNYETRKAFSRVDARKNKRKNKYNYKNERKNKIEDENINDIIKENLDRVEKGEPLNISLAILDGDFKNEYIKRTGANLGHFSKTLAERQRHILQVGKGIYYEKRCSFCDKKFNSINKNQKFCCSKCSEEWKEEIRNWKKEK